MGVEGRGANAIDPDKGGSEGIMLQSPSSGLKNNPPYPPLTGGYKKAMCSRRAEGVLLFLTPLIRGGRGGCLYPLRRTFSTGPTRGVGGLLF